MSVVFVDTETTGLDPETERIFELAIATQEGECFEWHFEPSALIVAAMHPKALEVTRYHERVSSPDWVWHAEAEELDGPVRALLDGEHLVGAVPDFDARHLAAAYRRLELSPPRWHYHLIDVEALTVGFLAAKGVSIPLPWDSDWLSRQIGIEPDTGRHEALYDALWAKRIYETLMNGSPGIVQPAQVSQELDA